MMNTQCPWCGKRHDAATCISDEHARPSDGDVTMCIGCGEWAVFDATVPGGLRKPTHAEFAVIAADADCRRARDAFVHLKERSDG